MNGRYLSYEKVTFNTSAPEGHLPRFCFLDPYDVDPDGGILDKLRYYLGWAPSDPFWMGADPNLLFSRVQTCEVWIEVCKL